MSDTWWLILLMVILFGGIHIEEAESGEFKPVQQGIVSTLIVADWLQTREIARSDEFYETNPILGRNPSQSEVNRYFLGYLLGYNLLAYTLEPEWSERVSIIVGVGQASAVLGNLSLGIKIKY